MKYFILTLLLGAVSCTTAPSRYWKLDLSEQETPIMLTATSGAGPTKTLHLKSGTQTDTTSYTNGSGKYASTITISNTSRLGDTFADQLQLAFLQNPPWVLVTDYGLNYHFSSGFGSTNERQEFELNLNVAVPR